jgi:hypothetical protein
MVRTEKEIAGFENRPESDMEFMHTRMEMRMEGI